VVLAVATAVAGREGAEGAQKTYLHFRRPAFNIFLRAHGNDLLSVRLGCAAR
jgi:hypothetical protein